MFVMIIFVIALKPLITRHSLIRIMCFIDAAMVFFPIAIGALSFTGVKLYRKYKETKKEPNSTPTTTQ